MGKGIRFALCGLALTALAAASLAGELGVGIKAPPLAVAKWIKGKPAKLGDGKVRVVEFWATWCGPCKVSIPHLTELQKKLGDKVDIIGVSIWEEKEATDNSFLTKVEDFVKEWGGKMDYRVAADGYEGTMAKTWMEAAEGQGIPTAFIVGKDGTVLWIGHPMAGLDVALDQVLAGTFDFEAAKKKDADRRALARMQRETYAPLNEAIQSGDTQKAIQVIDQMAAKEPKMALDLGMTKFNLLLKSDEAAAYDWARTLAGGAAKDNVNALNSLAWSIVDDKSPAKKPNFGIAVEIAERGASLLKSGDPFAAYMLDTLAYALYKNGNLDRALEVQTKAVAAAELVDNFDEATMKEIKDRLELFKTKKKASGGGG